MSGQQWAYESRIAVRDMALGKSSVVFGISAIGLVLTFSLFITPKSTQVHVSSNEPSPESVVPEPSAASTAFPTKKLLDISARPTKLQDQSATEPSLMSKLRGLGETNPLLTLQLARQGNSRFPESADAPERGWMICKSLVNMQRFEEAKTEARIMVDKYPDTPWTVDVQKHLLVNPLTDPTERGYGKKSESEQEPAQPN